MKKTFALICTLAMLLTSIPAGAFELENVESSTETAVEATAAETAAEGETTTTTTPYTVTMDVPGKNVLTGDKTLLDFEGDAATLKAMFTAWADKNTSSTDIVTNTAIDPDDVTHGNMFALTVKAGTNPWASININNTTMAGGRKYYMHFEEYTDSEGTLGNAWGCITNLYGKNKHQNISMGNKAWATWNNVVDTAAGATINFRTRASQATTNVDATAPENDVTYYWDNLGFYPYYKIGYVDKDGKVTYDQFLFEEGAAWKPENIAAEYTVKTEDAFAYQAPFSKNGCTYTQIGWSTDAKATTGMTTVELENKDIMLLPVYEVTKFLTVDNDKLEALSGTQGTITAEEEVEWSYTKVNNANVDVTISADKKTLTVTSKGDTGTVDVVATAKDGTEYSASLVITGGGGWKPGLNWLTYTDRPLDLEQAMTAGLNRAFSAGASKVADNNNMGGTNYSNKVFKISGGSYPSLWTRSFNEDTKNNTNSFIDIARPLYISYDYYSVGMGPHWVMVNGASANDIYYTMTDAGYGNSSVWKTAKVTKATSQAKNKYTHIKSLGIEAGNTDGVQLYVDNLMFVPYYKITYMSADGESVLATRYYLVDEAGNIATKYPVDKTVSESIVAYALTPGGTKVDEVPLNYQDITLYALGDAPVTFINGETKKEVAAPKDAEFTFPTPEQAGFENVEHFVAWLDSNKKPHFPGEKVAADKVVSTLQGQNFTAWCQDLTQPAVGFAAEGTSHAGLSKANYAEAIEDEGRSVIHFHQWGSTWTGSKYESDARIHFTCRTGDNPGFDATEYNIIQYAAKTENLMTAKNAKAPAEMKNDAENKDYEAASQVGRSIYYYYLNSGDGYYKNGAGRLTDSSGQNTAYGDGKYHVYEWDMANANNSPTGKAAWSASENGRIYGFAIDPAHVSFAGDTYIDYIRVYRDGYLTVTYDSNADCDVVYNVPADTGRGGGVNYLLKGDVPVLAEEGAGYRFVGWSLTREDAENHIVVNAIPTLSKDTTVYASWEFIDDTDVPAVSDDLGIRSDSIKGVRFKSTISSAARDLVNEYGYIVAREDVLGTNELTFDFKDPTAKDPAKAPKYAVGVAYRKDSDPAKVIDKQLDVDTAGNVTFSAVCINIPEAHYGTKLVVRTYMNYDVAGNAFTLYGAAKTTSLKEAAQSVKDAADQTQYLENKTYIDDILSK